MLRLKQRDERRTKEKYSMKKVTYKDIKSKEVENVTRKPIEMLTMTLQEGEMNKNETLLPVDEFIWRTRREGEMSKNVTLLPISEFVWKIRRDNKENKKETLQLIKWRIGILLQE